MTDRRDFLAGSAVAPLLAALLPAARAAQPAAPGQGALLFQTDMRFL